MARRRLLYRLVIALMVVAGVTPFAAKPSAVHAAAQGTWAAAGDLNTSRSQFALATLNDGRVLASGGYSYDSATNTTTALQSAEVYDPATDMWTATSNMHGSRQLHVAVT